jgi:hypothetical protein
VGLGGSRRILEPMQAELQRGLEPAHACEGDRFGGMVRSQGRLDTHLGSGHKIIILWSGIEYELVIILILYIYMTGI